VTSSLNVDHSVLTLVHGSGSCKDLIPQRWGNLHDPGVFWAPLRRLGEHPSRVLAELAFFQTRTVRHTPCPLTSQKQEVVASERKGGE
jgi:hypothetical protein